jgi:serine/threonine protein kinase
LDLTKYPAKSGLGFTKFISHMSKGCHDILTRLLAYCPEQRLSAKQALAHPHFKDLVEKELKASKITVNNFKFLLTNCSNNSETNLLTTEASHTPRENSMILNTIVNNSEKIVKKMKDKINLPKINLKGVSYAEKKNSNRSHSIEVIISLVRKRIARNCRRLI